MGIYLISCEGLSTTPPGPASVTKLLLSYGANINSVELKELSYPHTQNMAFIEGFLVCKWVFQEGVSSGCGSWWSEPVFISLCMCVCRYPIRPTSTCY